MLDLTAVFSLIFPITTGSRAIASLELLMDSLFELGCKRAVSAYADNLTVTLSDTTEFQVVDSTVKEIRGDGQTKGNKQVGEPKPL